MSKRKKFSQRPWSEKDREAFTNRRLRATTIPSRRGDGPSESEWDWDEDYDDDWNPEERAD